MFKWFKNRKRIARRLRWANAGWVLLLFGVGCDQQPKRFHLDVIGPRGQVHVDVDGKHYRIDGRGHRLEIKP